MEFEWDETKRLRNIQKHRFDFLDAFVVFDGDHLMGLARTVGGEERHRATGKIANVYVTLIFTVRGEATRIISMRKARDDERGKHKEIFDA